LNDALKSGLSNKMNGPQNEQPPKEVTGKSMEMTTNKIESHALEVDGEQFRFLRSGSGPPLLLLHGLLGGSLCWRLNLAALARQHTVFAVDFPGFGQHDAPRHTDCSMQTQAARLTVFLEKLGLESVDVIGSSWGGAVAMFFAARSQKVRSMVLAAPVNPWSNLGMGRIRFFNGRLGKTLLPLVLPLSRPVHKTAIERMYGDPRRVPSGTVDVYSARLLRPGRAHNILNAMGHWEKDLTALRAAIPQIKARTLLVWGTRDGAVDVKSSEPLLAALPGSKVELIPGAGHLPFEETPETFNRLVLEFLEKASSTRHDVKTL
jgi:pimeloyl-ACP methyl ester carboxylesterase